MYAIMYMHFFSHSNRAFWDATGLFGHGKDTCATGYVVSIVEWWVHGVRLDRGDGLGKYHMQTQEMGAMTTLHAVIFLIFSSNREHFC